MPVLFLDDFVPEPEDGEFDEEGDDDDLEEGG